MAKTQAQLEEEIKSVYEQIEEYKRKYHEEVELKREREEELRKKEDQAASAGTLASSTSGSSSTTTASSAAAAPASPWRAAVRLSGSPSVSSNSSPSSSTSTTPHASNDSVPTRRPLSKNEEELKKDKKEKKDRKEKKEKKEKKKHNKSLTRHSSGAVPTTAPSLPIGGEAAAAATAVAEKTFTVRSLQAHKATSKNELSFAKGVTITVIEENKADDLFKGQIGKKEGWFPSFYVVRT
jgi:DNA repair exonuclease SbcCD ATPase subunit